MINRKQKILQEAIILFAAKGYEGTTTAEIARAAGVSEGAIFRHFKSKKQLLQTIFLTVRETFFEDLDRNFSFDIKESGLEMVLRLVRMYCRFYETRETEFDFIHRNNPFQMVEVGEQCRKEMKRIHNRMLELLTIGIKLGLNDGSIRDIPVRATAMLIVGLLSGTARLRLFESMHLSEIEEEVMDFCYFGLGCQSLNENGVTQEAK